MGCIWSSEKRYERCMNCGRKGVNNLVITDNLCEICILQATRLEALRSKNARSINQPASSAVASSGNFRGEFKCSCGHSWISTSSWAGKYQKCRIPTCMRKCYATPTDSAAAVNAGEHRKDLCEECERLGDCKQHKQTVKKINYAKTITFATPRKGRARSRTHNFYFPSGKNTNSARKKHTKAYRSWTRSYRKY